MNAFARQTKAKWVKRSRKWKYRQYKVTEKGQEDKQMRRIE